MFDISCFQLRAPDMFKTHAVFFKMIHENIPLHRNNVKQKAFIQVSERRSEATAMTGESMSIILKQVNLRYLIMEFQQLTTIIPST